MWHGTEESNRAAGSKPREKRRGTPEARRYHHYWRDKNGTGQHKELPWVALNRPKVFIDKNDNAIMIYSVKRQSVNLAEGHLHAVGELIIAAATVESKWQDWQLIHVAQWPFVNEMLGDVYRWRHEGVLSLMVQESPKKVHGATALRIVDFTFKVLPHDISKKKQRY